MVRYPFAGAGGVRLRQRDRVPELEPGLRRAGVLGYGLDQRNLEWAGVPFHRSRTGVGGAWRYCLPDPDWPECRDYVHVRHFRNRVYQDAAQRQGSKNPGHPQPAAVRHRRIDLLCAG